MANNVRVDAPDEVAAIMAGEIEGDVYSDGEVYADVDSLDAWLIRKPQTGGTLDGSNR